MEAVFLGRQTGVGVIGEIPQGESSEEQDEQERALGMLTFNSQGEETGQEGSREQRPGKSLKSGAHPEHSQNTLQTDVGSEAAPGSITVPSAFG